MRHLSFLKQESVHRRLLIGLALLCIISLDLRPATKRKLPPSSAQNLDIVNCDIGCYTLGNHPLRVIIDYHGAISLVFFDSHALTAFSAIPALFVFSLYDHVSAAVLSLAYVMSLAQTRFSAPKLEGPKHVIPDDAKCIIVGVNDYVETLRLRTNHSCGYINYVGDGANLTERYFLKPKYFAETVENYGDKYDIIFLDRDAEGDVGKAIYSVPDQRMAMGVLFEAPRAIKSINGTNKFKRQTRVVVTRLTNNEKEERDVMVEALRGWARFRPWMLPDPSVSTGQDSAYSLYNTTFLNMFAVSDKTALGKHCSRRFVNRGDCMRESLDSVLAVNWNAFMVYCITVAGLCFAFGHLRRRRGKDVTGFRSFVVVGFCCFVLSAFLSGVIDNELDDWSAWYNDGMGSFHIQIILLVGVATRITWRVCESQSKRWIK